MNFKKLFNIFSYEKQNLTARKVDRNSNYYKTVINDMKLDLERYIAQTDLVIKPSVGQGNYAEIPWICVLSDNPRVSPSAQKGIYVVLLFTNEGNSFYLTLGQGITNFLDKKLTPKKRNELIQTTVDYFRKELPKYLITDYGFSFDDIVLADKPGSLARGYSQTSIISKRYDVIDFDERDFYNSLSALVNEYNDIIDHIGSKSYDDVIDNIAPIDWLLPSDKALESINEVLKTQYVEPRDVVVTPIRVTKDKPRSNKYTLLTEPRRYRKTDYILKAKEDHVTGLKGEEIALKLERKRIQEMNLDPDVYVKYVAEISDSFGYDIQSVDYKNGKLTKVYIEVKSTKSHTDTTFFVSKNEVDVSIKFKDTYRIFRIYDIMSTTPKYYTADGEIEENFYLDPVSYSARYKYLVKQ